LPLLEFWSTGISETRIFRLRAPRQVLLGDLVNMCLVEKIQCSKTRIRQRCTYIVY
jgi:hypothetical protein